MSVGHTNEWVKENYWICGVRDRDHTSEKKID